MRGPEAIGSIISTRKVQGRKKGRHTLDLLVANWPHLLGERMALHSRPTRLARGVLTVAAEGPAWAAEMSVESERLLRRITAVAGQDAVKKIKVQSRSRRSEAPENAGGGASVTDEEQRPIEGKIGDDIMALEDMEMRLALSKLVRALKPDKQDKPADR